MSAKKKISPLSFFRLSIQIMCFILLPTLYANTFLGIKTIYLGVINKNLSFTSDMPIFLEVMATILLTIIMGRFFCGWMCSFGAVSDWIYALFQKAFHYKVTVPEKTDKIMKYFRYIYLIILVTVIWNAETTVFNAANPWNAFATIFTLNGMPDVIGAFQYYAIGTILLMIILALTMVIERFFCRYLCPLGAIFSIVSGFKVIRIEKERSKCGSCKLCTKSCPMAIPLYKFDSITSGDCIQCQKCTMVCPRNNPSLSLDEYKVNAAIVSTLAVATISSINYTSDVLASSAGDSSNSSSEYASSVQGQYKDGTYEGSGTGFRGGTTTVSVTVENGNISDVEVVSYDDDKPFFSRAEETVISQIIENQTSDVDTVSGATYSSLGIMEAVENALSNAGGSSSTENSATEDNSITYDNSTRADNSMIEDFNNADNSVNEYNSSTDDNSKSEDSQSDSSDSFYNNGKPDRSFGQPDSYENAYPSDGSVSEDTSGNDSSTSSENSATSNNNSNTTTVSYADGTYEGSGTGFRNRTTTVSVKIENGAISNIDVVSYGDDNRFFQRAYYTISSDIINSQSTDVDTVSGATYSSLGIMEAVENALSQARN